MSKYKLEGLINYLNMVEETDSTFKKETLLEIANYTYSYIEKLEKNLKWYDHYKDSALGLKEKYNHIVDINKQLESKLKIAEEALQYYADGEDMSEAKMQGSDAWRYIVDDNHTDTAQQALQKMKEVNRC